MNTFLRLLFLFAWIPLMFALAYVEAHPSIVPAWCFLPVLVLIIVPMLLSVWVLGDYIVKEK